MAADPKHSAEPKTRAAILHPEFIGTARPFHSDPLRSPESCLAEAVELTQAIQLDIIFAHILPIRKATPATLIGKGQAETLTKDLKEQEVRLLFFNGALSPIQQRNLERTLKTKVIDRTGLILEIFGARARTREGQMQVELAALTYQRSRLVRSWTHLERQRGGFGFLGGPGESQLEIDRRLIDQRILRLRKDIAHLRQTRQLNRSTRQKNEIPVIALVGYTNAGKSTLFNCLAGDDVFAANLLFATLDPTIRKIALPGIKGDFLLSDTVGFIADLPVQLVDAFRATLEEVQNADIILHVRDISHEDTEAQKQDVLSVLEQLGIMADDSRIIEVLNKIDRLPERKKQILDNHLARKPMVALSALSGAGMPTLVAAIKNHMTERQDIETLSLSPADGAALAWLYAHGHVLQRDDQRGKIRLEVSLSAADSGRFHKRFKASIIKA